MSRSRALSCCLLSIVTTKDHATELVVKHYKRQGVLELYKLMGTVDLRAFDSKRSVAFASMRIHCIRTRLLRQSHSLLLLCCV